MSTKQKSLRLPDETVQEIENYAKTLGKDFSSLARDLIVEAVKMRKCPGVVFADGPSGRRARIAGTGIDVWELIAAFKGMSEDYGRLKEAYHWLGEAQIRSALSFYALYPQEIDDLIDRNERITEEQIVGRFPFLAKMESAR
ncbi:MAG: hypothetical protein K9L59_18240 [Desulfobacterales bacterium]|nr:hypothetical protein [Desulfobacterales bacterium]